MIAGEMKTMSARVTGMVHCGDDRHIAEDSVRPYGIGRR